MDKQGPTVYNTGNYMQSPMINHNGKEYKKKNACTCITESLLLYSRDWHHIVNQLYFNKKKLKKENKNNNKQMRPN